MSQPVSRPSGVGELHYPGNCVADTIGRVMGPSEVGQLLTAYHAEYDEVTDTTTAHMRPATQPEVNDAVAAGLLR